MDDEELNKEIVVKAEPTLHLLDNPSVIRWCYEPVTEFSLITTSDPMKLALSKEDEKTWGNEVIQHKNGKQWTTKLCQSVVMEALIALGRKNVRNTTSKKSSVRDKFYQPDLECDEYIYEVKGRSWCTPGTAGEKILGVPLKYGELPSLYKKSLRIVLVGYQEYEARQAFGFGDLLDPENQTQELKDTLTYFREHNIEYLAFTDILRELGKELQ